jgi:uncharacterized HhH-GPD family protein
MAKRVQALCQLVVEKYDGDAAAVWTSVADCRQLLRQVSALPGCGEQKATIFVGLLGKKLGVTPPGWRVACAVRRGRQPALRRRHHWPGDARPGP